VEKFQVLTCMKNENEKIEKDVYKKVRPKNLFLPVFNLKLLLFLQIKCIKN
jgi:hypothetical protein